MAATIMVNSAFTGKKNCLVCGRSEKSTKLLDIKTQSIVYAYLYHRIYINPSYSARCCRRHVNKLGLIHNAEFNNMRTRLLEQSRGPMLLCNHLSMALSNALRPVGIFDQFNYIDSMSDDFCKQVTGWSKTEYNDFSRYITSIYDTEGRSKEFLIALYRYWLRKGTDEETLALLVGNSSQQQISHYLAQIRKAITTDFVHFYLGADKGREFFCNHKNESIIELHQLGQDDLVICADATYCRIEKSFNNQFQYDSWSQQKLDSLIKPFIVCCGDGYIIDCYGPFKAHQNDAKIFDYILENDQDFANIIEPEKTICFVDRGELCV